MGHTDGKVGRRVEGLDQAYDATKKPREENVIRSLLESMKQAVEKKKEPNGTLPTKQPSDLPPLELGILAEKLPTLNIKGDCKTIIDWVNGRNPEPSPEWWGRGIRLRQRTAECVTHTFREHNKEADQRADKGAKGRVEEWVDTTRIAWPEVTSLCGFLYGSCDNGNCAGGIMIVAANSDLHGWCTFYKKCGPLLGKSSLDAEMGGCGMHVNGWKSAPAEGVQLFGLLRLWL